MRNTKKNRETQKKLIMAISAECEKVYGKKIGMNASRFDWDLRFMPQPNWGKTWAYVSWNDFDCMIDAIRTYGICYYTGKKPTKSAVGRTFDEYVKVSEKELNALVTINYETLQSVTDFINWRNGVNDKERKNKERKQAEKEMKLDFDGEITLKEINDKYNKKNQYYINAKETKISFHKKTDSNHYLRVPEFSINIKTARKDYDKNGWFMRVYNKKEFETKIKAVK